MADDHHRHAVNRAYSADNGGIVRKAAVSVQLHKVIGKQIDIVQRIGSFRMPRNKGLLPGIYLRIDISPEIVCLLFEVTDLLRNIQIAPV